MTCYVLYICNNIVCDAICTYSFVIGNIQRPQIIYTDTASFFEQPVSSISSPQSSAPLLSEILMKTEADNDNCNEPKEITGE